MLSDISQGQDPNTDEDDCQEAFDLYALAILILTECKTAGKLSDLESAIRLLVEVLDQ